ncbi:MAG: hypothetical protein E6G86_11045 [Alphaproteobacteria bacterium]|nr:MAG: hypothetical protein E6G86_11045 [Alphaproteobacteria bacterium]
MVAPPRWMCLLAFGLLVLDLAIALPANAQDYPNQTLKIVVPFVAGGGVDVVARIIAPNLSEELGQPVIIENRGGAGGMIGAAAVAQAPPDGYTLLVGTGSTHGTNSSVYSHLPYDPVRDFTPIVLISSSPRHRQHQSSRRRTLQFDGQDRSQPRALSRLRPRLDRSDGRPIALHVRRRLHLARLSPGRNNSSVRRCWRAPLASLARSAHDFGSRPSRLRYDGVVRFVRAGRHAQIDYPARE